MAKTGLCLTLAALGGALPILAGAPALAQQTPLEGVYLGPYLSHSSLQSTVRFPRQGSRAAAQFNDIGGNTLYAGARAGYARVLSGTVFLAGEVNFRYAMEPYPTTILSAAGYRYEMSTQWEGSAVARAGVVLHGRTAVYLAAGLSRSRLDIMLDGRDRGRALVAPTAGVGFETMVSERVSLRGDWMADRSVIDDPLKITLVRWNAGLGVSYWF